ncbi:MAG: biotin/lipoate A/B protein ligase family protein [Planctomycetota bacterium]
MQLLDLTLPAVVENLALDEALLEAAESGELTGEVLRLWESSQTAVVLGRASCWQDESSVAACRDDRIEVVRRASGGAAVMIGRGCLMYALILDLSLRPELANIDAAHQWVMQRLLAAIRPLVPDVEFQGTCDLTYRQRKFSGNSLRCKRGHLLYHGTILYDFPVPLLTRYLGTPPRQPAYRAGRGHEEFVTNLPVNVGQLRAHLQQSFAVQGSLSEWPQARTSELASTRYQSLAWNQAR